MLLRHLIGLMLASTWSDEMVEAALRRTKHDVIYDGSYRAISYPGGDVPANIGVCTDVVIRAYRAIGIDLQKSVHEDMSRAFEAYPRHWALKKPDPNIDHRRVPNLQRFFERKGASRPITHDRKDYLPGDLVTWTLSGNRPHIGIVVQDGLVVHNIGAGPELDDALFSFPISGHYRFRADLPKPAKASADP